MKETILVIALLSAVGIPLAYEHGARMGARAECRSHFFDDARNGSVKGHYWMCQVRREKDRRAVMEVPIEEAGYWEVEALNWRKSTQQ